MDLSCAFPTGRLSISDVNLLKRGNLHTIEDILLNTPQGIAKRCKASPAEVKRVIDIIIGSLPLSQLNRLDLVGSDATQVFTTGDSTLDKALGGGITTGSVWEVVGESAAGKTQLALQLSLFVQAPVERGGLAGATCYLTTSSKLPTPRLLQICQAHERLSPTFCTLSNIHTMATPTVQFLQHTLTTILPAFIKEQASNPDRAPVKLLVIDALAELFHSTNTTSASTLYERSQHLTMVSSALHRLASTHNIAVLVLNEVIDVFDRGNPHQDPSGDMSYNYQSRWYNALETFSNETLKEASLGLVWANQVNTRIMLTRTGRRRYLSDQDLQSKRRRVEDASNVEYRPPPEATSTEDQAMLIRRLAIVFSNLCPPASFDYIVTSKGISILNDDSASETNNAGFLPEQMEHLQSTSGTAQHPSTIPFDNRSQGVQEVDVLPSSQEAEEEFDEYFKKNTAYDNVDWDALEQSLSQDPQRLVVTE